MNKNVINQLLSLIITWLISCCLWILEGATSTPGQKKVLPILGSWNPGQYSTQINSFRTLTTFKVRSKLKRLFTILYHFFNKCGKNFPSTKNVKKTGLYNIIFVEACLKPRKLSFYSKSCWVLKSLEKYDYILIIKQKN